MRGVSARRMNAIARFNRRYANAVVAPVLTKMPGFGVVAHVGRRSGRTFTTPVKVFDRRGDLVIALPYGAGAQWVRNVVAGGGCRVSMGDHTETYDSPRIRSDRADRVLSGAPGMLLRALGISDFLVLRRVYGGGPQL